MAESLEFLLDCAIDKLALLEVERDETIETLAYIQSKIADARSAVEHFEYYIEVNKMT